jgi:hypothetical protein
MGEKSQNWSCAGYWCGPSVRDHWLRGRMQLPEMNVLPAFFLWFHMIFVTDEMEDCAAVISVRQPGSCPGYDIGTKSGGFRGISVTTCWNLSVPWVIEMDAYYHRRGDCRNFRKCRVKTETCTARALCVREGLFQFSLNCGYSLKGGRIQKVTSIRHAPNLSIQMSVCYGLSSAVKSILLKRDN